MAYDYHARAFMPENLDSMPDYATALKIYNARKPYIKGKYKGERPLGSNRKHCRSRINMDDEGNIRVKHWQTDVITYHPDGYIMLQAGIGSWSSISTAQIMQELLGLDKICRVNGKIYYRHNDRFYLAHGVYAIRIDPNGYPINVNDEWVYTPRSGVLKKYRKQYAFFSEYAKQVLTMSSEFSTKQAPDSYDLPEFEGATLKEWYMAPLINRGARHDIRARDRAREALFGYLDSLADKAEEDRLLAMYEVLAPITYMMGEEHYRQMGGGISWSCNYARFHRKFGDLLKHQFANEIFEYTIASKKSPVRDSNQKYIIG